MIWAVKTELKYEMIWKYKKVSYGHGMPLRLYDWSNCK